VRALPEWAVINIDNRHPENERYTDADRDHDRSPQMDAMSALAELGKIKHSEQGLSEVLERVSALAKASIPGVAEVSVTLVTDGVPGTAAYTGELALALDEAQYDAGYGPCLSAAAKETVYLIEQMSQETRWPEFTADALMHGARSSLSIGIPLHKPVNGAVNFYANEPGVFDDAAVELAKTFAGYAAVALANASLYETTAALARQMSEAMASRAVIEQAKGILVAQKQISPEEAFEVLTRASQAANRKLRDIAQAMVDGAHSPNGQQR
jgi:GAF domain-containing protein